MPTKNHYDHDPIIEVVCQLRFVNTKPWDVTVPGMLFDRVKSEFPHKEQVQHFGIGLSPIGGRLSRNIEISSPVRFYRQDRTQLIQIAPGMLAVNQLPKYPGWESYKPSVEKVFKNYIEVASPEGIQQITLKYINRFEIPSDSVKPQDYFKYYPSIDNTLPQDFTNFNLKTDFLITVSKKNHIMVTLASTTKQKPDTLPIILDLEYVVLDADDLKKDQFSIALEKAHTAIENFFEGCLTDKAKSLCGIKR